MINERILRLHLSGSGRQLQKRLQAVDKSTRLESKLDLAFDHPLGITAPDKRHRHARFRHAPFGPVWS